MRHFIYFSFSLAVCAITLQAETSCAMPPFEKIYVTPYEILSTPSGTFYRSVSGEEVPVHCVCSDPCGTYVVLIGR